VGIPQLASRPGLVHTFSTLTMGSVPAADGEATAKLARLAGLESGQLAIAGAVHGTRVVEVDAAGRVEGADGLVTRTPGLGLVAAFADCYPILVHDPHLPAVALGHAGWRGTAAGIATELVGALVRLGASPGDLVAGLGPGICGGCYEVGAEVAERFHPSLVSASPGGRWRLDLAAANRRQLAAAGLPQDAIFSSGLCTFETPWLPSHRRAADGRRFAAVVALR
jgi:YfiH family protein